MKRIASLAIATSLLCGCATLEKTQVQQSNAAGTVISATQTEQVLNTKSLKRKVAIGRFSYESKYGQNFFIDAENNPIGKQAMDILSAKLFETDRFIMLERADLIQIEKELALGGQEALKNAADFIIVGSITEFGRKEVSDVGIFSRVKKQQAHAAVNIRIIDVATGQIIYSEQGKGIAYSEAGTVLGIGSKAGYDGTLNDKVLDAAITNLASNIIENMLDKPWRSYILSQEDGNLIIAGGKSQNIEIGTQFEIVKTGKKIKNPQTQMYITLPGKSLAKVEVLSSFGDTPESEVSFCKVISGNIDTFTKTQDYSQLYIQETNKGQ